MINVVFTQLKIIFQLKRAEKTLRKQFLQLIKQDKITQQISLFAT